MSVEFDIGDHYQRSRVVYRVLGRLDGDLCNGTADKTKWYISNSTDGSADGRARPMALSPDIGDLDIERVLYSSINYVAADFFMDAWDRFEWTDGGRAWSSGDNPMPGYGDLTALAPFADIDLRSEKKAQRPEGELDQATVEEALARYAEGFAELCGGLDAVYALDSVGGAYVMVAPSVTSPISERFGREERALIFEELSSRVNDHLSVVSERVAESVDGHDELLDPDMVTHKNRVYKAPLSLHASLDGVVTPMSVTEPDYSFTPATAVTDTLVDETEQWAHEFTDDYRERVGVLVEALWGGSATDWEDTLSSWVDEQMAEHEPSSDASTDTSSSSLSVDSGRTEPMDDVYRALDALDARDVAEKTIVAEWNKDAKSGKGWGFYPTWGPNSNGTANYVSEDVWHDTGASGGLGDHGTVVEMALISEEGWPRGQIATGKDWIRGIRCLRDLGFDVPLPQSDVDEDMSPYYTADLAGIAREHGISPDPYEDDMALLRACLHAREEMPALGEEKPPYGALRGIADYVGLRMEDEDEGILGESSYSVAKRMFDDFHPVDVE